MTVNGTLDCSTFVVTLNGPFVLASGATLKTGLSNGLLGVFAINGGGSRSLDNNANYEFNGSVAQNTSTVLPNNLTGKLTINNTNGVTLSRTTAATKRPTAKIR